MFHERSILLRRKLFVLILQSVGWVSGMTLTDYQPEIHDRFSSGYPGSPVRNESTNFIGAPHDWSGVGWAINNARKSFGFVSPSHFLVARHFDGTATVRIFGADGQLHERSQRDVRETGLGVVFENQTLGDLSLGTLNQPFAREAMPVRYGVLDLNSISGTNSTTAYTGIPLRIYGHGGLSTLNSPRVAATAVTSVSISGNTHRMNSPRTEVQLQDQDSGSPAFTLWTNPAGNVELAIIGNHAAISDTQNIHNFLGSHQVITALNNLMRPDGRALRVVAPHSHTWDGSSSTNLSFNSAWGLSSRPNATGATSDRFVLFNGDSAVSKNVNVNSNYTLRGLYFLGTDPFSFSGTSTLTLGRGGITVYGETLHQFTAPLALGSDQVWNIGGGSLSVQALNLNTRLLEVLGTGTLHLNGPIGGGSGGLAVDSGQVMINSNSSYTGATWVHGGELTVFGDLSSSQEVILGPSARVTGSGTLPPLRGAGTVQPSGALLTAESLNGSQGLSFAFEFNSGEPDGHETLRLTGTVPFTAPLSGASTVDLYLPGMPRPTQPLLRGGFFTDADADFLPHLAAAQIRLFIWEEGAYRPFAPEDGEWQIDTVPFTLAVEETDIEGRILQLTVLPPPGTYARWIAETFPPGTGSELLDPLASPNSAGIVNLLSYAHGWDPLDPDPADRPVIFAEAGVPVIRWAQNPWAGDVLPTLQHSSDLLSWSPSELVPELISPDSGKNLYEVRPPPADRVFYRIFWQFIP